MKIFVHVSSLIIKGKPSEVVEILRAISRDYPQASLQDYLRERLS